MVAVAFLMAVPAHAEDLQAWLTGVRQEAEKAGISQATVNAALPDDFTPDERVLRLDGKQPEHTITFEQYKRNVITPGRIRAGRELLAGYRTTLNRISAQYGVEPEFIVALWGLETSFGHNQGGFNTIHALATLAYEGRRGAFFRDELIKALRIVDHGDVSLARMKGSWAGAMGQCQFMPTSFEKFAQDDNHDGKRDIWDTRQDVFASIAAYLSGSGWKKGQPWGRRVDLPDGFDPGLLGRKVQKPVPAWSLAGVTLQNGRPLPADDAQASIIQPGGDGYKAYAVYGNYRVLMQWNTSIYFATAVGLFADQLK